MDDEIAVQVAAADARARNGRAARLKVLLSVMPVEGYPVPALAHEYFEEARLCWYVGAYVATVLMVQLAFEELLRSSYRTARGVGGRLDSGVLIDRAGFGQLIHQGRSDGFLSRLEANELASLKERRVETPTFIPRTREARGRPFWTSSLR